MVQTASTDANKQSVNTQDVLFYVLPTNDPQSREAFLSKLLNKIWKQQRQCDVRFATEQEAERFDLTLWDYQAPSFIPHSVQKQSNAPIQLYGEQIGHGCQDVLINLHPEFPQQFLNYQRTIEVLDQSEYLIQMGRQRWKQYKTQGIEPTIHKL